MKYSTLRNKQVGDKDLEMKSSYKKKRLFEIQEKELKEDQNLSLYELEDENDNKEH